MSTLLTTKDVATLIATRTLPRCLEDLAGRIRADFLRWPEFDKSARLASHSRLGVIELMPVADARYYSSSMSMAIRRIRISACPPSWPWACWPTWPPAFPAGVGTDPDHRAAHGRHVRRGRAGAGPSRRAQHGADRQRRAK